MNADGSDPSAYYGKWPGHSYFPSPEDWREIAIYHLLTDRFRDGDPRNNDGRFGGYDVTEIFMRQGGDFQGIAEKLDYIKSLGFDAIWISPIFQNGANEYHGYGQIDYTLLDDRFGTLKDFRHLVDEAHRRQMYVIVDIVVNHMGNLLTAKGYEDSYTPFKFHTGEYDLHYRDPLMEYADFKVVNNFIPEGTYPSVYSQKGKLVSDFGKGSYWESDFHHNGGLTDYHDPWSIHLGKIYDKYDDLRTGHERVQKKIVAMTEALISSTDIDGIRMDTPMQVPISFFEYWLPEVRAHAESLGKKNFLFFAETYCTPELAATLIGRGREKGQYGKEEYIREVSLFDGGIDYLAYKGVFETILFHRISNPLRWILNTYEGERKKYDFYHEESKENRYRSFHFFGSHDQRRIGILKNGQEKLRQAINLLAAWPGIPIFYYGDEQGFNSYGAGIDGHAREPMMHSVAWRDHPAATEPNVASKDNFDMSSASYRAVQEVMQIRKLYPVLQKGELLNGLYERVLSDGYALAFQRSIESGNETALFSLNTSSEAHTLKLAIELGADWKDISSGKTYPYDAESKTLSVELQPGASLILVPENQYVSPSTLNIGAVSPPHDALLVSGSKIPGIEVTFSEPVEELSLRGNLFLNKKPLRVGDMTVLEEGRKLVLPLPTRTGLYELEVRPDVRSRTEKKLQGVFTSRFFIVDETSKSFFDQKRTGGVLISGANSPILFSKPLRALHYATGSSYFRVFHDGNWGPWTNSTQKSDLAFKGSGWKDFTFQYWIDGSSAYFASDGIDAYGYDGFGIDWAKSKEIQRQLQQTP